MGQSEIGNISNMADQGQEIVDTSADLKKTITEIYDLYDALQSKWQGQKAQESKEVIDRLRPDLQELIDAMSKQGDAVNGAANDLLKIETA
jgi:uncharacterized protein YukE